MNLREATRINNKILKLIKLKYEDDFPLGYHTPESRYYELIEKEIKTAQRFLGNDAKK